ncbi:MAG: ArdC family protein [Alphaproteobacteria bacterium]
MAKTKTPSRQARRDVAAEITQRIIDELDKGVMPWRCNWRRMTAPCRAAIRVSRTEVNLLILCLTAHAGGYSSPYWMSYKQAGAYGAQVRKGERSTLVIYYGTAHKREAPDEHLPRMAKTPEPIAFSSPTEFSMPVR